METQSNVSMDPEPSARHSLLKVTLLMGGATLLIAGALCWRLRPSNKAQRMLDRAQRKMEEAEAVLAELAE
jgi:hypothetical protein